MVSRRKFLEMAGVTTVGLAGSACGIDARSQVRGDGRLKASPRRDVRTTAPARSPLGLGGSRDGILQLPAAPPPGPMPLLVLLHGAGGSAERQLARFGTIPADNGVAVLAIDSRGPTWDVVLGAGFGPDVEFIDRALQKVFDTVSVDPRRLVIGGFSDGASYGLSLGLINGDLFPKVAALSVGFLVPAKVEGKPRVFMSHGTFDDILPIERCGRVVEADLRKRGYDVTFREFAGRHEVPPAVATEAFKWMAAGDRRS